FTEPVERLGGRLEAVFEHEGGYAVLVERLGDFPPLVAHREPPEAAAGRDDDGRAVGLVRIWQEGRESGGGDVPRHRVAPLAEPGFGRGLAFDAAGAEGYGVRLVGRIERVDRSVLRHRGRGKKKQEDQGEWLSHLHVGTGLIVLVREDIEPNGAPFRINPRGARASREIAEGKRMCLTLRSDVRRRPCRSWTFATGRRPQNRSSTGSFRLSSEAEDRPSGRHEGAFSEAPAPKAKDVP